MPTLGVLVAGGAGARLGAGVPKALARLGGGTLLARATGTLASACDEVVVVAPAALDLPRDPRARRVDDAAGASGPLAGMVAGLAAASWDRAFVLGVDFPFLTATTVKALLERLDRARREDPSADAVIPAPGGIAQPLAAAYAPRARDLLAARLAAGERAPGRALGALVTLALDDTALAAVPGGADAFFNLNTPADLAAARARFETGAIAEDRE
jgi:molybdopterin-guanine dinucleotide biosynthesis protein A